MPSPEAAVAQVDTEPFDLPGDGAAAALCLHGLTGTPYEVRSLGDALSAAGIHALGPALPGHNQTPRALANTTHLDWLEAARAELRRLRSRHASVFLVGLSMGGLLCLALAAEEPIEALAVIGTPLRLRPPLAWAIPVLKHVVPFPRKRHGSDIRDQAARRRHPSYDVMPLAAVHEMQRLQRRVQRGLRSVRAPLLVAHGAHDHSANPADSKRIFDAVGSEVREHLILEASAHVVPVDHDAPLLAREVVRFLGRFA